MMSTTASMENELHSNNLLCNSDTRIRIASTMAPYMPSLHDNMPHHDIAHALRCGGQYDLLRTVGSRKQNQAACSFQRQRVPKAVQPYTYVGKGLRLKKLSVLQGTTLQRRCPLVGDHN